MVLSFPQLFLSPLINSYSISPLEMSTKVKPVKTRMRRRVRSLEMNYKTRYSRQSKSERWQP